MALKSSVSGHLGESLWWWWRCSISQVPFQATIHMMYLKEI